MMLMMEKDEKVVFIDPGAALLTEKAGSEHVWSLTSCWGC